MTITKIRRMERAVISAFVKTCTKANYWLRVWDGEAWASVQTKSYKRIMEALFSTDEDHVIVLDKDGKRIGWTRWVYGNGGYDVLCDCSLNLEKLGLMEKCDEVARKLEEKFS